MSTATMHPALALFLKQRPRAKTPTPRLPVHLIELTRNQLPHLFHALGFTRGAEIGVWKGGYSARLCKANPDLHLLCVDPWLSYPAWLDTKNEMPPEDSERIMSEAYRAARKGLKTYNCTLVRKFSTEAAQDVPDGSLDFAYIDGNHVYDAVTEDIQAWLPKVRSGGVLAGHDYRDFSNKPTIHVKRALDDYTIAHGIDPWFITAADRTPSWLWVVP